MESFKQRLCILEEKTQALELNMCKSHETENEIHIQNIDKELGVIPLNEFDTLRFGHAHDWLMPEYTRVGGSWKHGVVSRANLYFLTNHTQEIKEVVELSLGQKINFNTHRLCFKYYGEKTSFESMLIDRKIKDAYIFWYQGGPCYGKFSITQKLYNLLNYKPFEVIDIHKHKPAKNPPYDFILSDFINGMNYSAKLIIDLKNPYKLLPHISFFLHPLDTSSLKVILKTLSPQQAVFELTYGKDSVPTSTQFHWMASGSV